MRLIEAEHSKSAKLGDQAFTLQVSAKDFILHLQVAEATKAEIRILAYPEELVLFERRSDQRHGHFEVRHGQVSDGHLFIGINPKSKQDYYKALRQERNRKK